MTNMMAAKAGLHRMFVCVCVRVFVYMCLFVCESLAGGCATVVFGACTSLCLYHHVLDRCHIKICAVPGPLR